MRIATSDNCMHIRWKIAIISALLAFYYYYKNIIFLNYRCEHFVSLCRFDAPQGEKISQLAEIFFSLASTSSGSGPYNNVADTWQCVFILIVISRKNFSQSTLVWCEYYEYMSAWAAAYNGECRRKHGRFAWWLLQLMRYMRHKPSLLHLKKDANSKQF